MPEVIDPPPSTPQRKTLFTAQTAILAAQKSVAARRLKSERLKAERIAERLAAKNPTPHPEPPPPPVVQLAAQTAIAQQLVTVDKQITRTLDVLDDDDCEYCPACERSGMQPHHRAQLLKALDSLLDRQRILLGIPLPGSLKPGSRASKLSGGPGLADAIAPAGDPTSPSA